MEQRNIIGWNEHSEYSELTIPSGVIWMSESELAELFGVSISKLRNAIHILYKEKMVIPYDAERTIMVRHNVYQAIYGLDVVLLLAFHLNSYKAKAVRRELTEAIIRRHKPFEIVFTTILQSWSSGKEMGN